MYGDFFDAPRASVSSSSKSGKSKRRTGTIASKRRGVRFTEDEVHMEEADQDEEIENRGRDFMGQLKQDLFDDEEPEEQSMFHIVSRALHLPTIADLSTHERRQLELAKQITELEQEAIGPKEWTLLGEASSRSRPENSLLEENLDFEQVGKVVPVVTEDTVKTLEEMIKTRIRDVSGVY